MSDESGYMQFLAEARSGGQAGMGRLAVLVWERLFPFVLRTIRNRDAAEDILQETLLTMLRRLDSLRDGRRFGPGSTVLPGARSRTGCATGTAAASRRRLCAAVPKPRILCPASTIRWRPKSARRPSNRLPLLLPI